MPTAIQFTHRKQHFTFCICSDAKYERIAVPKRSNICISDIFFWHSNQTKTIHFINIDFFIVRSIGLRTHRVLFFLLLILFDCIGVWVCIAFIPGLLYQSIWIIVNIFQFIDFYKVCKVNEATVEDLKKKETIISLKLTYSWQLMPKEIQIQYRETETHIKLMITA